MTLGGAYAVHELLYEGETEGSVPCDADDLHVNEAVGKDIHVDQDGVWRELLQEGQAKNGKGWAVSAGPIEHRGGLDLVWQSPNCSRIAWLYPARTHTPASPRHKHPYPFTPKQRVGTERAYPSDFPPSLTSIAPHLVAASSPLYPSIWRRHQPARTFWYSASETGHLWRLCGRYRELYVPVHVCRP